MATSAATRIKRTPAPAQARGVTDWFQVDRDGLAKLLEGRGPERMVLELIH